MPLGALLPRHIPVREIIERLSLDYTISSYRSIIVGKRLGLGCIGTCRGGAICWNIVCDPESLNPNSGKVSNWITWSRWACHLPGRVRQGPDIRLWQWDTNIVTPYDKWIYLTLPLASSYKTCDLVLWSFPPVITLLVRGCEAGSATLDEDMLFFFFQK